MANAKLSGEKRQAIEGKRWVWIKPTQSWVQVLSYKIKCVEAPVVRRFKK